MVLAAVLVFPDNLTLPVHFYQGGVVAAEASDMLLER